MVRRIATGVAALALAAPGWAGPLVEAAGAGDADTALRLVADGADVQAGEANGTTALHWAVYHDQAELVGALLSAGADPMATNGFGSNPMREAAIVGNPVVLRLLLAAGADADSPNADGQTALMVVARSSNTDAARVLLEAGADVNARERWRGQTALMWAAAQRQPDMVRVLLEHGADPDARSAVNDWKSQVTAEPRRRFMPIGGLTPMLLAARHGCTGCVQALAEAGADVDLPDPEGRTPLNQAITNLNFDVANALLDAGASHHRWDRWGQSPLYHAVDVNTLPRGGYPDRLSTDRTTSLALIERLLDAGADPNLQLRLNWPPYRSVRDDRGCDMMLGRGATPLLRAAKGFDIEAMRLLLAYGADVELPNDTGVTPLMAAAGFGSIECDTRGPSDRIPQYYEDNIEARSIEALEVLLDAGANLHARTREDRGRDTDRGQTALHGAAFWGWSSVVTFLVENGAKVDSADPEGRTPVDAALGRAGGHGRGSRIDVFEDTARLLVDLCGQRDDCELPTYDGLP